MIKIKRIENKADIEKKENRNRLILGVFLVAIMVFGTAGYSFLSREKTDTNIEKADYNGLAFSKQGELWQTQISDSTFYFQYLPNETRSLSIKKSLKDFQGKPLYFTGNGLAEEEIYRNLKYFIPRAQQACLRDTNCTGDFPVKSCADNVIIVQEKEFSNVAEEDNCTFIFSNDTVRDADAFLYKIFGIK